jgi:type I restriction enzyme, S subunit
MVISTSQDNSTHFLVKRSQIDTSKIFVEYYLPEFQEKIDALCNAPYPLKPLKKVASRLFDGPFGSNRKVDMYQDSGVPYIRVKDVLPTGIDLSDIKYISEEKHQELNRSRVVPGNVLITIAGRVGTAAVFPDDLEEGSITGHIAGIEVPKDINPHYIAAFLNSPFGVFQVARLSHRTTRPEMNLKEVGSILVSVPPRALQDQIAQVMQEAYGDRQNKLEQAEKLLTELDSYVFDVLNLAPESVEETRRFLKSISTIQGGRFDVEFNMGFHKFDPYMDQVFPVKAIATFPKETKDPTSQVETLFNYIDIGSIDIELGEIREVSEVLGANAPSRARQVVHTGDIIISTVRPTRGATALIPESMDGFICSTGFSIVRPNNQVTPEYLHTVLRLHTTLEQFGRRSAGSSYPAILDRDVKETLIPVPSKEIQHKISIEVIRRRSEAKRLRSQAEAVVAAAKARVERMILGEDTMD